MPSLVAAIAIAACLTAPGGLAAEGVLLHASFDATSRPLPPPATPNAVPGLPGGYADADFAAGNPVPTNVRDLRSEPRGRFGAAVSLPRGSGMLAFDTLGNVLTRRGTLAFWARFDDSAESAVLLRIGALGITASGGPDGQFLDLVRSGDRMTLATADGRGGRLALDWTMPWAVGAWRHFALAWDAALGWRVFIDGTRVAEEHRPLHYLTSALDNISLGCVAHSRNHNAAAAALSFDELWAFDYELNDEQVRRLMRDNRPPERRNEPTREHRLANERWLAERFGWEGWMPPYPRREALVARLARVERVRDIRMDFSSAVDGKPHTVWPLTYKGYSRSGAELDIRFAEPTPVNYLRALGDLSGSLMEGESTVAILPGEAALQRTQMSRPATLKESRFLRAGGKVHELDFYHLSAAPLVDPSSGLASWDIRPAPAGADLGEPGRRIQGRHGREDRTVLLAGDGRAAQESVAIHPWQLLHIVTDPLGQDLEIGKWVLDLRVEGFTEPTRVLVQIHDPVTETRQLAEFDFEIDPAAAGSGRIQLVLDGPALLAEAGRQLWASLLFDQPGRLLCGPGGSSLGAFQADVIQRQTYLASTLRVLCDQVLYLSEPGRWRQYGGDPLVQFNGIAEIIALSEHLMHWDRTDPTAASITSWMLRWRDRWDPAASARYTDPLESVTLPKPEREGPEWAVRGREALIWLRRHVDWWIGERAIETGELGSRFNDDTDIVNDFVNFVLINDPGDRIRDMYRRLADFAWDNYLTDGISTRFTDHLHAFEEGTNILHAMALMYYGEPEHIERLMITSRAYDSHLTRLTPEGDRIFASTHYSATRVGPPLPGIDSGMIIAFTPGRYLVWYNANPRAFDVLSHWQEGWLRLANQRLAQGLPAPTSPHDVNRQLTWIYEMTGDPRYLRFASPPESGPADEKALIQGLKDETLHMTKFLPVHTWVGQSVDRIDIPLHSMARMYLGGAADKAKRQGWHYHHVSWENADDDIARFVVERSPTDLRVALYNFHDTPKTVTMRVWRLENGRYEVRTGLDTTGDRQIDRLQQQEEIALHRYSPMTFTLPPQQEFIVTARQLERYDDLRHRADLALGRNSVRITERGRLEVTVHNIGGGSAPAAEVQLLRDGRVLQRRTLPALAAPIDLVPKRAIVHFDSPGNLDGLSIRVEAPGLPEITKENNTLPLSAAMHGRTLPD